MFGLLGASSIEKEKTNYQFILFGTAVFGVNSLRRKMEVAK
jgi:hypothetical protein